MVPLFYEGFKRPSPKSVPEHVIALLNHEGVRVYAEYDSAVIERLAGIIRSKVAIGGDRLWESS